MRQIKTLTADMYCKMGSEVTPVYRIRRKNWFDRKVIERVLTGRNQHNRLGCDVDIENHAVIIDGDTSKLTNIISEIGVKNYLKRSRVVSDESKQLYYDGLNHLTTGKPIVEVQPINTVEPIQPCLQMTSFVKIEKTIDGKYVINYWNEAKDKADQKKIALSMLTDCIAQLVNE